MGTWGPGIWENDGALDFMLELERLSPKGRWRLIERDIRSGDRNGLGAAVPACEALAFLLGQGRLDSRESVLRYAQPGVIADDPTPALVQHAVRYLERLSKQRAGFFRAADERKWSANLRDLAHRLRTATIQTRRYPGWSLSDSAPRARRAESPRTKAAPSRAKRSAKASRTSKVKRRASWR